MGGRDTHGGTPFIWSPWMSSRLWLYFTLLLIIWYTGTTSKCTRAWSLGVAQHLFTQQMGYLHHSGSHLHLQSWSIQFFLHIFSIIPWQWVYWRAKNHLKLKKVVQQLNTLTSSKGAENDVGWCLKPLALPLCLLQANFNCLGEGHTATWI